MISPHPNLSRQYLPLIMSGVILAMVLLGCVMGIILTLLFTGGIDVLSLWATSDRILATLKSAGIQASLSAFLSVIIGFVGAYALYYRPHWPGQKLLLQLGFIAMILPTTVAALALTSLWGRTGIFRQSLEHLFGQDILFDAYGLEMVVLAHIFFNAPLVMRVALSCLQAIPQNQLKLASQLEFSRMVRFQVMEAPALLPLIPSLLGLIFLLCFSSFSLVLMLGGGPSVTTLEVAIYTSVRFEFDLPTAAILSVIQLICSAAVILVLSVMTSVNWTTHIRPTHQIIWTDNRLAQLLDGGVILALWVMFAAPVMMLVIRSDLAAGLGIIYSPDFWDAAFSSLYLGLSASIISVCLSLWLAAARYRLAQRRHISVFRHLISLSVSVYLVVPSIVLGTASFIWLRGWIDIFSSAFWLVLAANVAMGLPFASRILAGRYETLTARTDRLCQMLNISGLRRLWHVTLPGMHIELGLALGLTAALSFGDLGVITLFGSDSFRTLPLMLYQYSARYGAAEADILALVMLAMALLLYSGFTILCRQLGRRS